MAVELAQGKVDPVILNCAVTPNHAAQLPDRMSLTYRDATGTSAAAFAKAFFVKINRASGVVSTISSVSSNASSSTAVNFWQSGQFAQALDFNTNYYFVRLLLDRSATSQTVQAFGVAVENNCGNGKVEAPENCDDGNYTGGDGCSAVCLTEVLPFCGDGALDPGEECDDGNTTSGDGCSAQCLIEP
jgi:cysteine-rich repeat protein